MEGASIAHAQISGAYFPADLSADEGRQLHPLIGATGRRLRRGCGSAERERKAVVTRV